MGGGHHLGVLFLIRLQCRPVLLQPGGQSAGRPNAGGSEAAPAAARRPARPAARGAAALPRATEGDAGDAAWSECEACAGADFGGFHLRNPRPRKPSLGIMRGG